MKYNYDFWYQPRHNVMVSSEWAAPSTTRPGFKLDDVKAGKYGQHLHFWDWETRKIVQEHRPGREGADPAGGPLPPQPGQHARLRRRGPVERHVALAQGRTASGRPRRSSRCRRSEVTGWDIPGAGADHRPRPVDGRQVALLLELAARRHPPVRRERPGQAASSPASSGSAASLGKAPTLAGKKLAGGPQMLQLSLDGKRLYVTNSLFSSWDNQFYPQIAKQGS